MKFPSIQSSGLGELHKLLEWTPAVSDAGLAVGVVPIAFLPALDHPSDVAEELVVPRIDEPWWTSGECLGVVEAILQEGHAADNCPCNREISLLARRPDIASELTPKGPLAGPAGS